LLGADQQHRRRQDEHAENDFSHGTPFLPWTNKVGKADARIMLKDRPGIGKRFLDGDGHNPGGFWADH
jgi:hypothetical protein